MIKKLFLPMPGSKQHIVRRLIELIPPHNAYVEVFGGGATLLFRKPASPAEIYNDINGDLVNLFRVIRDKKKFWKFFNLIYWTLYSREEYNKAEEMLKQEGLRDIERAYYFYVHLRQSFGTSGNSWGYGFKRAKSNVWFNVKNALLFAHRRLADVQIERDDFRNIIKRYDREDTFFYLDPPYYPGTRVDKLYEHEMDEEDHEELFDLLINLKGKGLLSGYYHPAFKRLEEAGWQRREVKKMLCLPNSNTMGNTRGHHLECLWFNYETRSDDE